MPDKHNNKSDSYPVPENEEDRIAALRHYQILDTSPEEAYDRITRIAACCLNVPVALVSLVDEDRLWFKSRQGLEAEEMPRELAFCTYTIMQDHLMVVEDASADPRFKHNPLVNAEPCIRFYAGAPLITRDGYRLGTLCAIDHQPRTLSEEQQGVLTDLAGLVIEAMELRLAAKKVSQEIVRKEQEANTLHQNKTFVQAVLDNVVDGIITTDQEGMIESFNRAAERIFGYSQAELKGKSFNLLLPEPFYTEYLNQLQHYAQTGESRIDGVTREVIGQRKDGSRFPMEAAAGTLQIDGRTLFAGIVRDITARKQIEQQLRDREARLSAIVDTAVDGIITIDHQGIVEACNHAAETIFGYAADEVIGNNISMLMPQPYAAEHDGYLASYMDSGQAKIIGIGREVTGLHKDGHSFPMDLAVAEVNLGDQRIFTGLVRDVTQRQQAEHELIGAKEAAEKANRAKSDFLSRMSHELRTPLNAILGFGQILEMDDTHLTDRDRESVSHIIKAGRHLTELINEVLDIARIESGRQNLSPEPVQARSVLEDAWSLIRPLAAERHIQLKQSIPEECNAHVLADLQRLMQVLLNLMSNAVKYNHDGGSVTLFCSESREGILRISVSDTGPGIAVENRERIFEPFERLGADETEVEGSGVGLALSKALIEAMGGILNLDSEPGVGSTFWLELPLIDEADGQEDVTETNPGVAGTQQPASARPATLLYIEDNITNLRLIEVALSRRPHIKLIASMQGKLGIDLALQHKPDLILLDLHLPGLMGDQVLARLKAHPQTQHIPVVMISADATKRQIKKLLAAGAYAYITKPFNIKELIRTVDTVLASRD